jgi:hypothetical protein
MDIGTNEPVISAAWRTLFEERYGVGSLDRLVGALPCISHA